MGRNLIAFAIPLFFILIGLELWAARRRGRRVYRFADALADMGCGIVQQTGAVLFGAVLLAGYSYVYEHARLITYPAGSPVPWILAMVMVDLLYYWWHRLSHEVNVLWAVHVVHHQSEDYNLAVALRQAILSSITSWPFYLVLAFLGVPAVVMATSVALNTLYQFWIHTELVGKLGFLERFLNTPSHHRVHHAINPGYLDKNFAGVLIIWDRMFGTFVEEREPAVFGITRPLRSFNPVWAQVDEWVALVRQMRSTPRWRDKVRVWFASPAWHPPGAEVLPSPVASPGYRKHDVEVPAGMRWYVGAHFALEVVALFFLLLLARELPAPLVVTAALLLMLSLVAGAGLMERKGWAPSLEVVRLALLGAAGLAASWATPFRYATLAAVGMLAGGAWWILHAWRTTNAIAVRQP